MIEAVIREYLEQALNVPVYLQIPNNPAAKYVSIERTGGGDSNFINSATFAIQSWADSLYEAANLNEQVKELMNNAVTLPMISASDLNSDYNYTDTTTKKYRYQAVYDLTHY